jgi:hypothetical protein
MARATAKDTSLEDGTIVLLRTTDTRWWLDDALDAVPIWLSSAYFAPDSQQH